MAYAVQIMGMDSQRRQNDQIVEKTDKALPTEQAQEQNNTNNNKKVVPWASLQVQWHFKEGWFLVQCFCLFVRRISNSASGSLKMTPMMTSRYNTISKVWDRISTVGQSIVNTVIEDRIESADNTSRRIVYCCSNDKSPSLKKVKVASKCFKKPFQLSQQSLHGRS